MSEPLFLDVMGEVSTPGEWIDSMLLAKRIDPTAEGSALVDLTRDCSRKLSNLHRFGHIDRRQRSGGMYYEYFVPEPSGNALQTLQTLHA